MSDGADGSMLDLFREELAAQTDALTRGLIRLEQSPSELGMVQGLMRAAHSIKGASRIVGLTDAVRLAHAVEDLLAAIHTGRRPFQPGDCDLLLGAVDVLCGYSDVSVEPSEAWLGERRLRVEAALAGFGGRAAPSRTVAPTPSPSVARIRSSEATSTWDVWRSTAAQPLAQVEEVVPIAARGTATSGQLASARVAVDQLAGLAQLAAVDRLSEAVEVVRRALEEPSTAGGPAVSEAIEVLRARPRGEPPAGSDAPPATRASPPRSVVPREGAVEAASRLPPGSSPAVAVTAPPSWPNEPLAPALPVLATPPGVDRRATPPVRMEATVAPAASVPPAATVTPAASVAAPAARSAAPAPRTSERYVRVSSANLDRLLGLAAETLVQVNWLEPYGRSLLALKKSHQALARHLDHLRDLSYASGEERVLSTLRDASRELGDAGAGLTLRLTELEEYSRRSVGLSDRLYHEVIASRMRPLSDGLRGLPRAVREIARELGKQAQLEVVGEDTEVDRDILERLEAPLSHVLRNAVAHGIEPPEERVLRGKPTVGRVRLEAAHRAGMLWIQVSDDGRGIDVARARATIVERGFLSAEAAEALNEDEVLDYLFLPGFSTAAEVNEIAGRGVGLDVVRSAIGDVGGSVLVTTEAGSGTVFQLELPLTLSVVRTLLVEISGEMYAVPLTRVEQVLRLGADDVFTVQGRPCTAWNGHNVGLVPTSLILERPPVGRPDGVLDVVCVRDRSVRYGLCVDRLLGEQDLVVRPLDARLGNVPDVSAAAVMGDGTLVLILDVDNMMRSIGRLKVQGGLAEPLPTAAPTLTLIRKRILVADDSDAMRDLLTRRLELQGFEVDAVADGAMAFSRLSAAPYDMLISDVDMPNLNGFELVRRVRDAPAFRALPVMLVSYNDTDTYRSRAMSSGADGYATKDMLTGNGWLDVVRELLAARPAST